MASPGPTITLEELDAFCRAALQSTGLKAEHATCCSEVLVTTDSWGVFTHGTKLLVHYLKRLQGGGLRTDTEPAIATEGPAWAILDGQSVMGMVTSVRAMQMAVTKARRTGLGFVGVRNSCHFGAAGYYAWLAAREGMIGLANANDIPSMAAPGSTHAITGTNPFAFAAPAGDQDPILLDMSLSTVAGGKVYAACQRGEPIPADWIIGRDGQPTTDGSLYPDHASLAPAGRHKGYGLALMNEILAGVLPGAGITWGVGSWMFGDPAQPTLHGASFLAIDVAAMMAPETFQARVDHLIREIHQAPSAPGVDHVMVPGEREWAHRRRVLEHGLTLPPDVVEHLQAAARLTDLSPRWLKP